MRNFNFPDVCRKYNTAERKQSKRFLECLEENFLIQVVREPGAPLDLLFANKEALLGDVMAGGCLEHRGYEMIESLILGEERNVVS